jgi:hypothetical protein
MCIIIMLDPEHYAKQCKHIERAYRVDFEYAHQTEDSLVYTFAHNLVKSIENIDVSNAAALQELRTSAREILKIIDGLLDNYHLPRYYA